MVDFYFMPKKDIKERSDSMKIFCKFTAVNITKSKSVCKKNGNTPTNFAHCCPLFGNDPVRFGTCKA